MIFNFDSVPSFDSIPMKSTMESSSSSSARGGGFSNERERDDGHSVVAAVDEELKELIASKERIRREIEHLEQQVRLLIRRRAELIQDARACAARRYQRADCDRSKARARRPDPARELESAREANVNLKSEMEELRESAKLYEERIARAIQERDSAERSRDEALRRTEMLRDEAQKLVRNVDVTKEKALRQRERAVAERKISERRLSHLASRSERARERAVREAFAREEMQEEMRRLYADKIVREKELHDCKSASSGAGSSVGVDRLEAEIRVLRGENASLRSAARRDSEVIESLNDEIKSLAGVDRAMTRQPPPRASDAKAEPASRKRALAPSRASAGEDERSRRERKHSSHFELQIDSHRDRFNSAGGGSLRTISGMHEDDFRSDCGGSAEQMSYKAISAGSGGSEQMSCLGGGCLDVISGPSRERLGSSDSGSQEQMSYGGGGSLDIVPVPSRGRLGSSDSGSQEQMSYGGGSSLEIVPVPSRDRLGSADSGSLERTSRHSSSLEEQLPKERLDTCGCDTLGATVSTLDDVDNASSLFGQDSLHGKSANTEDESVKSEHDEIRAHAERLLYWANRASERSSKKSDASVASRQRNLSGQNLQGPVANGGRTPSLIPTTIGLPPRSQSRVRKSSPLPPRCPPPLPSSSSSADLVVSDDDSSASSDKENGGPSFNAWDGAFPAPPTRPGRIKNAISLEIDTSVGDSDHADRDPAQATCCGCADSLFSGDDARSEFYLPKLRLACNCGRGRRSSVVSSDEDDADPTALVNILRPWQCEFLSTLNVTTADAFLRAHKADANDVARRMRKWRDRRSANEPSGVGSKECYVALKIWSGTCKVALRSAREGRQSRERRDGVVAGEGAIVLGDGPPRFWDISFGCRDADAAASVSTLGQFSSVVGGGGDRSLEMMEI